VLKIALLKEPQQIIHLSHPSTLSKKNGSLGLAITCDSVLFWRYLLRSNSHHTPSSLKILNNHLLNKHLFLISNTFTPRPLDQLYSILLSDIYPLIDHFAKGHDCDMTLNSSSNSPRSNKKCK
jgi:hypothetical protein